MIQASALACAGRVVTYGEVKRSEVLFLNGVVAKF